MNKKIDATTWLYVLVQNPGGNEQIVAQHDEQSDTSFIPAFLNKESAGQGVLSMPREKGHKYEIQAIIYEDLAKFAGENHFLIFILDEDGKIIEKFAPGMVSDA